MAPKDTYDSGSAPKAQASQAPVDINALCHDCGFTMPTGPLFEATKLERRWFAYQIGPVDPRTGKKSKKPIGGEGWNLPERLMTFEEAGVQVAAGPDRLFGYYVSDDSLMVVGDLDVAIDQAAPDDSVGLLKLDGYKERSVSGKGIHVLMSRPITGSDFTHDTGRGAGFIGKNKGVALTFELQGPNRDLCDSAERLDVIEAIRALKDRGEEPVAPREDRPHWVYNLAGLQVEECVKEMLAHVGLKADGQDAVYEQWIKIGMAVMRLGKKAGVWLEQAFIDWSATQPEYNPNEDWHKKLASFAKAPSGKGRAITAGTLIRLARDGGWDSGRWETLAAAQKAEAFGRKLQILRERFKERQQAETVAPRPEVGEVDEDTVDALLDAPRPVIRWQIENLIGPGLNLLVGAPKVGKSFLMLQIAEAVATGQDFLGMKTNKGNVLYFAIEDGKIVTTLRIQDMMLARAGQSLKFRWAGAANFEEAKNLLIDELMDNPETDLVILDTFRYFNGSPPDGGSMNAQDKDFGMLKPFKEIAIAAGVSLLASTHEKKGADGMDIMNAMGGSALQAGTADAITRIQRDGQSGLLTRMGRVLANSADVPLVFHPGNLRWEKASAAMGTVAAILAGMRKGSVNYKIVEMMRSNDGQMLERDLVEAVAATGSRKQSVERVVRSLIRVGVLRKHGVVDAAGHLAGAALSLAKPGDFVP